MLEYKTVLDFRISEQCYQMKFHIFLNLKMNNPVISPLVNQSEDLFWKWATWYFFLFVRWWQNSHQTTGNPSTKVFVPFYWGQQNLKWVKTKHILCVKMCQDSSPSVSNVCFYIWYNEKFIFAPRLFINKSCKSISFKCKKKKKTLWKYTNKMLRIPSIIFFFNLLCIVD